ncbi:MAG: tRNA/rRNA methyltransferase, partial [Belnapia sp.]|nr:tRNA/rRNA methyltransferase [Belnapia sp.]
MTQTAEDWMDALKRIAMTDPKRAWLRAHLDAPDCTATEAALAAAAGQPIAQYQALAAEFAVALDVDLPATPLALLAERAGEGGLEGWRLRAPLAFALGIHRVVPDAWTRGGKDAAKLHPAPGESPIIVLVRP